MPQAVIDASVVVHSLIRLDLAADADRVLSHYDPVFPDHLWVECANALARYVRLTLFDARIAEAALTTLCDSFEFIDGRFVAAAAFARATRFDHGFYDGLYLALAEEMNIPFVTADAKFLRKMTGRTSVNILNLYALPKELP